jgi:Sec-independent protein translocase protein TatA
MQKCPTITRKGALQKTNEELREEIKISNEALRQELTHNLKEKISKEVRNRITKRHGNLKQDLKDDIFQELGVNLQRGLGNFKREIKDDLQQSLVLITQHQEEKHNELLNLIKGQGHQQATQPQPSDFKHI